MSKSSNKPTNNELLIRDFEKQADELAARDDLNYYEKTAEVQYLAKVLKLRMKQAKNCKACKEGK